jgi:Domain of unknown function (DUF4160)
MKISGGIASTTHVDSHGQRMAKSLLDQFALQIKTHYVAQLIRHDSDQHKGINLSARVMQLDDGEYALLLVSGIFENEAERAIFLVGAANTVWASYESMLDEVEAHVPALLSMAADEPTLEDVPYPQTLAGQLEFHLNSTSVAPDGTVYLIKQRIANIRDLEINIYPKDHEPPHFHVRSRQRNMDARFHVETLEFINEKTGTIKPKEVKQIQDFFQKDPAMHAKLKREYDRLK